MKDTLMVMPDSTSGKMSPCSANWDGLLQAIKEHLLMEAKNKSLTGEGTVVIQFHQGGVTGKKFGLTWISK